MSAIRLADIGFEDFSAVEVCDVLGELLDWGILPLSALIGALGQEPHNSGFANSVINDLQTKFEDLGATIERLSKQWNAGRVKPDRIRKLCEKHDAELESLLKGIEPELGTSPEV